MSVIRFGTLFLPRFAGVMSCCASCVFRDVVRFTILDCLFFVYFSLFTFCLFSVCFFPVCSRLLIDLFCLFVLFCFVLL